MNIIKVTFKQTLMDWHQTHEPINKTGVPSSLPVELHSHFNTSDFIILIERWNTTQWNFFIIIIETKSGLLKTPKRGRRRRRRNCQCSQFFQLLAWPRNPRLSLKCLSSSLIPDCLQGYWRGAGLRNEWGRAGAHHPAYYKGHFVARSVCADTKLPFPFMVIQLCSLLHQSNSDVCQQPERVPHDAFPRNTPGMWKVLARYTL